MKILMFMLMILTASQVFADDFDTTVLPDEGGRIQAKCEDTSKTTQYFVIGSPESLTTLEVRPLKKDGSPGPSRFFSLMDQGNGTAKTYDKWVAFTVSRTQIQGANGEILALCRPAG